MAAPRSRSPSLSKIRVMCVFTVASLITSTSALSSFVAPRPISRKTSTSRVVNSVMRQQRFLGAAMQRKADSRRQTIQVAVDGGVHVDSRDNVLVDEPCPTSIESSPRLAPAAATYVAWPGGHHVDVPVDRSTASACRS